jgi:hypothetical protein
MQAFIYPILPFVRVTEGSTLAIIVMLIATLIVTFWCAVMTHTLSIWVLACCWIILASSPSVFLLDYQYIIGSPRLLYFSSAGAAMLWTIPVIALTPILSRTNWISILMRCLQIILLACLIITPLPYIVCQMNYMSRASDFALTLAKSANSVPVGTELIYVNLPFYFTNIDNCELNCPKRYPFAPVGAVVIPPYASLRDFIHFNGGPDRPARAVIWRAAEIDWAPFVMTFRRSLSKSLSRTDKYFSPRWITVL